MGFELKDSSYMFTGLQCAVTKTFSNHYGKGCIQIIGAFCTNFYSILQYQEASSLMCLIPTAPLTLLPVGKKGMKSLVDAEGHY